MSRYGYDEARDDSGGVDTGDVLDGDGSDGSDPRVGGGGGSPGGSSPPPSDIGGPGDADPSPGGGGGGSPGGSSPPPSDIGGPGDADPSPGGSSPPPSDVGGPETVSGSTTVGVSDGPDGVSGGVGDILPSDPDPSEAPGAGEFGPGPSTPGGRGSIDVGGGESFPVAETVASADANPKIVERATTGGFLSERGASAGVLPSSISPAAAFASPADPLSSGGQIREGQDINPDDGSGIDISETRARGIARGAAAFGDNLDLGATFSSPASPLSSGGTPRSGQDIVDTDSPGDGAFARLSPDPENENPAEEYVEGGAQMFTNLPAGLLQTETVAEVAQSSPGVAQDFSAGEIAETSTAVGRDTVAETASQAAANPAEFAGSVTAGAALGAGALSRGSTGSLGTAVRAELDPRVGPFGTTAETRVVRGARSFLDDDRGQLQVGRQRGRDGDSDGSETVSDDADLGPDIDPFDRSDARLYDPAREFGDDRGGMAGDVDPTDPSRVSEQDIDGGVSGRGDPEMAPGVDAESFSERGFGDVSGTSLDPNPTDTLGSGVSPGGAGTGGLFAVSQSDSATGGAVGGLLGAPGDVDATGASPRVDADTFGGVDLDTGFAVDTDAPTDIGTDTPTDTETDAPTDTRVDTTPDLDSPTQIDASADIDTRAVADSTRTDLADPTLADPEGRDPRDPQDRQRPRDPEQPFEAEPDDDEESSLFGTVADDRLVDSGILGGGEALADLFRR